MRFFTFKCQGIEKKPRCLSDIYSRVLWPFLVMEVLHGTFQVSAVSASVSLAVLLFTLFAISEKESARALSICEERVV